MKRVFSFVLLIFGFLSTQSALAQDAAWVQVEAQPSLLAAEDAAREYATELENVEAYSIGSGWYAISIGPMSRDDANDLRRQLLAERRVPRDAFVSTGNNYKARIWPIGSQDPVGAPNAVPLVVDTMAPRQPTLSSEDAQVETEQQDPPETLAQSRAAERALSRDQKRMLQTALKWAGFYNSTIDGLFGNGTRRSMSAWQGVNGFEETGVLSTQQRAMLLGQYNAVLKGLGLTLVSDTKTGIEMLIPQSVVAFEKYSAPLAEYSSQSDSAHKIIQISQEGDKYTLSALFEALQTLAIIPSTSAANLKASSFVISGTSSTSEVFATATLRNGEIKGYIVAWPTGNPEQFSRVLEEIEQSFGTFPGTLKAQDVLGSMQEIDQVYGLEKRAPQFVQAGVYVSETGHVLTLADGLETCTQITLDDLSHATLMRTDDETGFAILKPVKKITPLSVADFSTAPVALGTSVLAAGFPFDGRLNEASLAKGSIAELRDLSGQPSRMRLDMGLQRGDVGGPILNEAGQVIALLTGDTGVERILPNSVQFGLKISEATAVLGQFGKTRTATQTVALDPIDQERIARAITAQVNCWSE